MDKNNIFVSEVIAKLEELNGDVGSGVLLDVRDSLNCVLEEYKVEKKKYDLMRMEDNKNYTMLKLYLATKEQEGKSPKTIKRYKYMIETLIKYYPSLQFEQYSKFHIRVFLDWYKTRNEKPLSNTSLNGMIHIYRAFFNWLDDEDFIPKSPIRKITMLKNDTIKEDSLTNLQCNKMIENAENDRDKALFQLLQDTGCRINEIANIKVQDVDFENRQITVLGKGHKYRTVYFTEISKDYLMNYLNNKKFKSEYLFSPLIKTSIDKPMCNNALRKSFKKIGNKSEINHMHPHRYRVTFVTNSLNRGIPIHDIAEIVGHAEIKTTMGYARTKDIKLKNEYDRIYN